MENKEVSTTKKITQELIGGWFLWGIVFGIVYSIIYSIASNFTESLIVKSIIAIIFQGIITFLIWKFSTKSTFKKRTMSKDDVPTVMKNLVIFTIIICVVNGIYQFVQVNKIIDKTLESNFQLKYTEKMMSYIYDDEQMEEYNKQKEEAISKVKGEAYTYLAILEIGLTVVYLAVLPLEKKEILKYVS